MIRLSWIVGFLFLGCPAAGTPDGSTPDGGSDTGAIVMDGGLADSEPPTDGPPSDTGVLPRDSPPDLSLIFAMDYSEAAAPLGGWTGSHDSDANHTIGRMAGGGPDGQDAYRLVLTHTGPTSGDDYWGHARTFTGAPFAYGDSVYFRFRFRWIAGTDFRAYDQDDSGVLSVFRNKFIIVNDGNPDDARFIFGATGDPLTGGYNWTIAKDGGDDPAASPELYDIGLWSDIQVELRYSSAHGVRDGGYRLWVNNNDYAAPDAESWDIIVNANENPGSIQFGAYYNNGVQSDGAIGWEHAEFQIDDDFHPSWH